MGRELCFLVALIEGDLLLPERLRLLLVFTVPDRIERHVVFAGVARHQRLDIGGRRQLQRLPSRGLHQRHETVALLHVLEGARAFRVSVARTAFQRRRVAVPAEQRGYLTSCLASDLS